MSSYNQIIKLLEVKCYICESKRCCNICENKKRGCFICGYVEINPECNQKNKNCKNCGSSLETKVTEIGSLSALSKKKNIAKYATSKVNFCGLENKSQ